ncbi:DEAD/DEAH box helicase [Eisenbergiella tayi]|uniref:DEAD/DEAH box helicase n=1 Tax=Eisenbergiella tayi TaxID=1432052 RepID=UPI0002F055BD|nr:DEAD/DEAH box helicase [Eisenbergiella tayi]
MLSRTDIRRECHKTTFEKGEELSRRGSVRNLQWTKGKEDGFEVISMEANVNGSRGNLYEVKIKIDEDYREILEYECECPAFYTYAGLCKHCAAVLLTYLEERRTGKAASRILPVSRAAAPSVRTSTYGFDGILGQYVMKDKVNLMQQEILGKVRLEPHFKLTGGSMKAEFRIGNTRMYVLKNIGDFVNAVARNERVSYGRELEFYHHPEAFAPESRPMVRFLQFTLLKGSSYLGNYLSTVYKRELNIAGDQADEFLEAAQAAPLFGAVDEESSREWEIREGEPERLLEINGDKTGISIKLQRMQFVTGNRYGYFFDDGIVWKTDRERIEEVREFLLYMESFGKNGLYVSADELPAFTRDMLPVLQEHFEVKMQNFIPEEYLPEEAVFEIYLDAPQRDLLTCELYSVYGEEKHNLYENFNLADRRDAHREMKMAGLVSAFFDAYDPEKHQMVIQKNEERLFTFLQEGIPRLQELCDVYISDSVRNMKILPAPHVSVGVSLEGELLELTLQSEEMPVDQLVDILSRYDRRKKYYRLKNGSFVDLSDEGIRTLGRLKQELQITDASLKDGKAEIPRYRAMYLDSSLKENSGLALQKNKSFRSLVRNMKTVEDNDFEIPSELDNILRGYQKQGFLWIKTLKANGFGGILADDMGLGKTLQVIAFLLSEWKESGENPGRPWLIVCPASLVYNWKSELERFAPALPVYTAAGNVKEREELLKRVEAQGKGVVITSYDLLRRDILLYEKMSFACEVIDEAQFIKNHSTQASRAVKQVSAGFRLALTGTPVENRLSELWSIFDFLMPGFLFAYGRFREELETPVVTGGDEEAAERLHRMIRPFVLRRLKKDVLTDLPDKIEKNMVAVLEDEQSSLYDAHVQRLLAVLSKQTEQEFAGKQIQVLAELTKLRQICCDPGLLFEGYAGGSAKMQLCLELIRNAAEGGHKVLLFSQFTSMLERLKQELVKEDISFYALDGSTPKLKRLELVESFNKDETQVFCISLKAGGTGLNLTAADIVIHFDPWWNVAVQNQATDRAHRIGQQNVVTVYKLIAKGTIEEKIVSLQEKKKELADKILGGEEMGMASFTKEELMDILRV